MLRKGLVMAKINLADDFAEQLAKGLEAFSKEVTEVIKSATDEVAANTAEELKKTSPKRTGKYSKDWNVRVAFENSQSKRVQVHNKKHYQLTHLLEYGHAKRGGGRVSAKPHIKAAEEKAVKEFEEAIKRGIQNADI